MKKIVFALAFLLCSTVSVYADTMGNDWEKSSIFEVKNPSKLFSEDWAALAVGKDGDMNAMTIGWGQIGTLWGRQVVTVYVAPERYTNEFMDRYDYFTVVGFPADKKEALQYIGTHSGRDGDKLKAAGLTTEFTELGHPIFKEGNLAIECKLIYKEPFKKELMDDKAKEFYERTQLTPHVVYIGEVVNVWKKKD